MKLFALDVKFDRIRRWMRNGTFEELLNLSNDIVLIRLRVIDVEMAEKIDGRKGVNGLMMERKRRLRIDEIDTGCQGGVHVFQEDNIIDLRK